MNHAIHPTAIVSPKAKIGKDAAIGPYTVIEEDVQIGDGVRIASGVHILPWTTVGKGTQIHTGAILGDLPQDIVFQECRSYLRIGERNIIREYVTIHRGTDPDSETVIGDENYLMGFSHVAHNCRIGNGVVLANAVLLAGYVQIADRAFLSGHVVVHQFVRIGRLAMVGGLSRVSKDVPPFFIVKGDSQAWGVNIVGLRRANFSMQLRSNINEAYKILYRCGLNTTQALEFLKESSQVSEIQELVSFIASSKRGICSGHNLLAKPELEDVATEMTS